MKTPVQGNPVCRVPFHITQADIDQMDYWLNEAGVANPAHENAICYAIQRLVLPGAKVNLRRKSGRMAIELDGMKIDLPEDLASWYEEALMGGPVRPTMSWLDLPRGTLSIEARRLVATRPATSVSKPRIPTPSLAVEAA
ncbi:MAG: hypothetical protein AAGH89_01315 [Verrucomicrobiota bacterium]